MIQEKYSNIVSRCSGDIFLDFPFSFTTTNSLSQAKTITLNIQNIAEKVQENINSVLPVAVVDTAKTVGVASSTVSIFTLSGSNTVQGTRTATISNVLTCSENKNFTSEPLSWYSSPTQISLGDGMLKYTNGALLGNWVLLGGIAALHSIIAYSWIPSKVSYPGGLMLFNLFLSSQTAQAATTMIRFGDTAEQAFGYISLTLQFASIAATGGFLKFGFAATTEIKHANFLVNIASQFIFKKDVINPMQQKWLPIEEGNNFIKKHGLIFKDYRSEWYGFIGVEMGMTLASGMLDSFNIEPDDCNNLIYAATSIYGAYALTIVALHPHRHPLEKAYYGSIATLQFTAFAIGAIQKSVPDLQNSTKLQTASEIIPVIVQYVTLARTIYEVGSYAKDIYKQLKKHQFIALPKDKKNQFVPTEEDKQQLLLPVPNTEEEADNNPNPVTTDAQPDNFLDSVLNRPTDAPAEADNFLDSILDRPTAEQANPPADAPAAEAPVKIHITDATCTQNPLVLYTKEAVTNRDTSNDPGQDPSPTGSLPELSAWLNDNNQQPAGVTADDYEIL
jgi:hypothetical protein